MRTRSWLRNYWSRPFRSLARANAPNRGRQRTSFLPHLETLEDRLVPAVPTGFQPGCVTDLFVSATAASPQGYSPLQIRTANSFPVGSTAGPDGNVWFAENGSQRIGRVNLTSSTAALPATIAPAKETGTPHHTALSDAVFMTAQGKDSGDWFGSPKAAKGFFGIGHGR
jgi:hypothetical protein